jgi:hypothetical protein
MLKRLLWVDTSEGYYWSGVGGVVGLIEFILWAHKWPRNFKVSVGWASETHELAGRFSRWLRRVPSEWVEPFDWRIELPAATDEAE